MYLPDECCQSRLSGTNGSNVSVIISLLMGYLVMNTQNLFVDVIGNSFGKSILLIFRGAVEIGKYIYEEICSRF